MKNREAGLQVRDGQKSFRASRIDQPNHPLGAEAVLGHQHEAGQHQVNILPREEDQRCPGSSCTVWTASPSGMHCWQYKKAYASTAKFDNFRED